MLGAQGRGQGLGLAAVLLHEEHLGPAAHHHRAHRAIVFLDDVALDVDGGLEDVDAALLERLPVGEDVLAGVELDDLRAEKLAVPEQREPSLRLRLAPRDNLGLEGLAEFHLLRQEHGLDHDLLLEGQRCRNVPDVGPGILGRLRDGEGIAHVLPPVGEEHEAVGVAGRRRGEGQLERLREVRPPPAHGRLRTIDLVAGLEGLIDHRFLAEDDDP